MPEEVHSVIMRLGESLYCYNCGEQRHFLRLYNEVVVCPHGELQGIQAVVTFTQCGHEVQDAIVEPEAVAFMLESEELEAPVRWLAPGDEC